MNRCIYILLQNIKYVSIGMFFCQPVPALGVGEQIIDAIVRSDFIFDFNVSDVPTIALGQLTVKDQKSLEIEQCSVASCEFDLRSYTQYLGMPVWVGQKNMLVLGESLERDIIDYNGRATDVDAGGALLAWIAQPTSEWQAGVFAYAYQGLGEDSFAPEPKGKISGAVARYRHSAQFHSYWGLVRLAETGDEFLYPYLGFNWYIGRKWSIAALIPWPSVNYALNKNSMITVGGLYSGASWSIDSEEKIISSQFAQVDLGLSYEHRIYNMLWLNLSYGYSGFGKLVIESDSEVLFESNISRSPFVSMSFNLRPE